MPHVVVLGLVLTLVAGVVSFAVLARRVQAKPSRLPRSIPTPLLLYNLWIAAWLVSQYLRFYVFPSLSRPVVQGAEASVGTGIAILSLAWLRSYVVLVDEFLESQASKLARRWIGWFVWTSVALIAVGLALWFINPAFGPVGRVGAVVAASLPFPIAVAASVLLALGARAQPDVAVRRALSVLSYSCIALFALLTVLLVLWRSRAVGEVFLVSADLVLELSYNVLMVVWVGRYARVFEESAPVDAETSQGFDALCESFRISPREREIIELVCLGLTNREIAARLFISVGTVKDHNYTIFQKAGVKNRTALAQLFTRPRRSRDQAQAAVRQASGIRRVV